MITFTNAPTNRSNSGTFTEGDFQISRQGLRISSVPSDLEVAGSFLLGRGGDAGAGGSGGVGGAAGDDAEGGTGTAGETGEGGGGNGGDGGSRGNSGRSGSRGGTAAPSASGGRSGGAGGAGGVDDAATADSEDRTGGGEPGSSRGSDAAAAMFDIALEELEVLGVVGRGSSGSVQRALHKPSGNMLAIKVVQMNVQADVRKNIIQELRTLHQSLNPNIVPYHGAFFSDGSISIILDYMDGGSLADVTQSLGHIPETQLAGLAKQVISGLSYLHKEIHIIHRDVKPSNLLVNCKGEVKISDFGVSGQLANSVTKCNSWVGTVTYMSPERISGRSYSFDSDIWSFGRGGNEFRVVTLVCSPFFCTCFFLFCPLVFIPPKLLFPLIQPLSFLFHARAHYVSGSVWWSAP